MRKVLLTIALAVAGTLGLYAQAPIPNGDFEQWEGTGNNMKPVGWFKINNVLRSQTIKVQPSGGEEITHGPADGQYFANLVSVVQNNQGFPGVLLTRFPYTERPGYFSFYTMYFPKTTNEEFFFAVHFTKWNTTTEVNDTILSTARRSIKRVYYPWTLISVPLLEHYRNEEIPDSVTIILQSAYQSLAHETQFLVDKMRFWDTEPVGVKETPLTTDFNADLNVYPNPASYISNLQYTISEATRVNITIYDMAGREIKQVVNEIKVPGQHTEQINVSELKPGMYFVRMQAGHKLETRKIMISR